MKSLIYIVALLSIGILGGCSARQDSVSVSDIHTIDFIEAVENIEEIKLSEYFSSIEYTAVETLDRAYLGRIGTGYTCDEKNIYITSGDKMRCIHIFTRDGKYVGDIGSKGRGPGEYFGVRSMQIIPESNSLMVESGYKVVFYSLTDGKCIQEKNMGNFFGQNDAVKKLESEARFNQIELEHMSYNASIGTFIQLKNKVYASVTNQNTTDQYLLIMKSDLTIDTLITMRQSTIGLGMPMVLSSYIYTYDNKINILHALTDTVYTLHNKSLKPHIAIDYGKILTLSTMPQIKNTDPVFSITRGLVGKIAQIYVTSNNIFTETESFVIGSFYLPKDISESNNLQPFSQFIYDKHSRKTRMIKHSEEIHSGYFYNDIDGGMPFWPTKHIGNKLYQFVDAGTFIEMSKKYNSPRMKEIAATLTEESNPVIIEATLKE
ncbi:MAG: 6-bladed beta-propeller [Bacteroidales bacterium]|nr:6-bladed beta-propeller [Bacteroidales bacterium]